MKRVFAVGDQVVDRQRVDEGGEPDRDEAGAKAIAAGRPAAWRAPRPIPSTRRTVKAPSWQDRGGGTASGDRRSATVSEVEEARALLRAHVSVPRSTSSRVQAARREPTEADAELGDRVAHGVVAFRAAGDEDDAGVDRDVEAALGQQRGGLRQPGRRPRPRALPARGAGRRATRHPASLLHDHDRVADPLDLLEVIGARMTMCMQNSEPTRRIAERLRPLDRVEAVRGLVEEHELGVVGDRRRELEHVAGRSTSSHQRGSAPPRVRRAAAPSFARWTAARGGDASSRDGERSPPRRPHRKLVVLRCVADARPHVDPGRRRILAKDGQRPSSREPRAPEREEGRLPRPVGAEQPRDAGSWHPDGPGRRCARSASRRRAPRRRWAGAGAGPRSS